MDNQLKVTYAIGDIHGMYDCLISLMDKIEKDIQEKGYVSDNVTIVGLGDYIDRGPKSRQVLEYIIDYSENGKYKSEWLFGNHSEMFILAAIEPNARNMWLCNGGNECLDSYLNPNYEFDGKMYLDSIDEHRKWLSNLNLFYEDEMAHYVHAGLTSATTPMEHYQKGLETHLIWSRNKDFYDGKYDLGKPVVTGHTPVKVPENNNNNCIRVDTGANWSGILTAAVLDSSGRIEFIQSEKLK